ncbi:MAG: hypothetical protein AB1505_17305 [Candidatus Latescibacterota bacterium]
MHATLVALIVAGSLSLCGCTADEGEDESGLPDHNATGTDGGSLVIRATYTGTSASGGTGRLFAYVYKALTNAQGVPDYQASTDAAVQMGTQYALSIDGLAPGAYYVLVFYDFRLHNQNVAGNQDRYVLYAGQHLPAGATAVQITSGAPVELAGVTFGDDFVLGSGGAYQ